MAKRSTLNDLHERQGAACVEQDGWLLPDQFGDPASEYEAVRNSAGIFDLANRAMIQFTGEDRLSYLQGMLSNDLRPLKMFDGEQSAILTQQAKVIADVRVLCSLNSYYLDFWEALKEKIATHLNRYLVADDVEITRAMLTSPPAWSPDRKTHRQFDEGQDWDTACRAPQSPL